MSRYTSIILVASAIDERAIGNVDAIQSEADLRFIEVSGLASRSPLHGLTYITSDKFLLLPQFLDCVFSKNWQYEEEVQLFIKGEESDKYAVFDFSHPKATEAELAVLI